jgi:hypothetical protein
VRLKPGVKLEGVCPEIVLALQVANTVYEDAGQRLTVTSVCDGTHKPGSLHYKGKAADLRLRDVPRARWETLREMVAAAVGVEFDVVLELEPPHLHLELDPKPKSVSA